MPRASGTDTRCPFAQEDTKQQALILGKLANRALPSCMRKGEGERTEMGARAKEEEGNLWGRERMVGLGEWGCGFFLAYIPHDRALTRSARRRKQKKKRKGEGQSSIRKKAPALSDRRERRKGEWGERSPENARRKEKGIKQPSISWVGESEGKDKEDERESVGGNEGHYLPITEMRETLGSDRGCGLFWLPQRCNGQTGGRCLTEWLPIRYPVQNRPENTHAPFP